MINYRKVKKLNPVRLIPFARNNSTYIMLYILFLSGLIIGTAFTETYPFIKDFSVNYFDASEPVILILIKNLLIYFSLYIFLFITGLCSIGAPFIMSVPLLLGIFYSVVLVSFYTSSNDAGLLMFLLLKLPSAILFVITVFLSVIISLKMVKMIKNAVFTPEIAGVEFNSYVISYIILSVFGLFAAIIDVISALIVNAFLY